MAARWGFFENREPTRAEQEMSHHHEYVGGRCIFCGFETNASDTYIKGRR